VAVNSIYASIIPSYKYHLVLKSFSYGTQVMGHPVQTNLVGTFGEIIEKYVIFLNLTFEKTGSHQGDVF
jgi:hypothetical protein